MKIKNLRYGIFVSQSKTRQKLARKMVKKRIVVMNDMKCPFCGKWLDAVVKNQNDWIYSCGNPNCEFFDDCDNYEKKHYLATPEFWQELIRTRKALNVAVDALNKINMRCQNTVRNHLERATIRGELCDISFYARKAIGDIDNLDKITALEQKDVK